MMRGRGLLLLQKVMETSSNEPERSYVKKQLQENSTTPSNTTMVMEEISENGTMESQKNPATLAPPSASTQVKPSYYISPVNSECSDLDDSDADPPFNPPPKESYRPSLVVPRKRYRSSSTTSSSSYYYTTNSTLQLRAIYHAGFCQSFKRQSGY